MQLANPDAHSSLARRLPGAVLAVGDEDVFFALTNGKHTDAADVEPSRVT